MSREHNVQPGDSIVSIAAESGFQTTEVLAKHPRNQALLAQRNPDILSPGDTVHIPDVRKASFMVHTGARYRYEVPRLRAKLRIRVTTLRGEWIDQGPYHAQVDRKTTEGTTESEGLMEIAISPTAREGEARLSESEFGFAIGTLDPIDDAHGWQSRLFNLGYLDDPDAHDHDDVTFALELFQADHKLAVTGEFDAATRKELLRVHGD